MMMILTYITDIDKIFKLTRGQGHKVKGQGHICIYAFFVSAINHELMNGSWWYLHIWLIMMRRLSWPKVKVTRSKVKVTYAVMQNSCFGCNSWTDEWILRIIMHTVDIDKTVKLTQGQGHKVKGQGHICIYAKFFFQL